MGDGEAGALAQRAVVVAADELGYGDAGVPLVGGGKSVSPLSLMAELGPSLGHLSHYEVEATARGLVLAFQAHSTQFRKSGEPYIIHPVAVACILAELKMDVDSIVAGLLHDTVEDTDAVTFEQIEERFNASVRVIVEGETKVSKIKNFAASADGGKEDVKAGDLQQMFIAMTEEVRVIIVKLADRLHNMRTLGALRPEKRRRIARETLLVFAPLARLLGMHTIQTELEELSFMHAAPDAYHATVRKLDELAATQEETVLRARGALAEAFAGDQYLDLMAGRPAIILDQASVFDVFERALSTVSAAGSAALNSSEGGGSGSLVLDAMCSDEPLDQATLDAAMREVRNVAQVRVVLTPNFTLPSGANGSGGPTMQEMERAKQTERQICYHTLGLIHSMWPPVPGTVKDYIAMSKPNGYQSLHTTVLPRTIGVGAEGKSETLDVMAQAAATRYSPGGDSTRRDDLFPLEIQIRTQAMHALAEYGICSEARLYSSGGLRAGLGAGSGPRRSTNGGDGASGPVVLTACDLERRTSWLDSLGDWQREFIDSMSARDFVSTVQEDLLGRRVFVFTPKGDIKNLPKDATVLDYAYHIHTEVGNTMMYAKVNSAIVSPDHILQNADVVDIVCHSHVTPRIVQTHTRWLQNCHTRSARHKLSEFLREQAKQGNVAMPGAEGGVSTQEEEAVDERAQELEYPTVSTAEPIADLTTAAAEAAAVQAKDFDAAVRAALASKLEAAAQSAPLPAEAAAGAAVSAAAAREPTAAAPSVDDPSLIDTAISDIMSKQEGTTGSSAWIACETEDRNGLLSEISTAITKRELNIISYSGRQLDTRGGGIMIFEVSGEAGDDNELSGLGNAISAVQGVRTWRAGCAWGQGASTSGGREEDDAGSPRRV